jgi:NADH-quinone oxidoreductase subunit B
MIAKFLDFFAWARANSPWMVHYCSGCCSLEILALMGPRYDWERYGFLPVPSPRQADFIVITGLVSRKVLPVLLMTYDQMPKPRYVFAIGSCAYDGGPYYDSTSVVTNIPEILPPDVFVAGCPPTPEAILDGLLKMKEIIREKREARAEKEGLWREILKKELEKNPLLAKEQFFTTA